MLARTLAVMVLLASLPAWAAPPQVTDPADKEILAAFLGFAETSAAQCTPERMAKFASQPEDIVWQASRYIRMPLTAYRLSGDAKYLDMFVRRMDTLCNCMTKGPDGQLGWYGLPLDLFRHPDHPDRKVDVELTDYEVAGLMAEFVRTVKSDAALAAKFAETAARYIRTAEDLVKKWEARGQYRDLGPIGAVIVTHADLKPIKASLTNPHNKQAKFTEAYLALYAATGRDEHLAKAIKIGTRFKHCLTLVGDHYAWNYLDPAGPCDVDPADSSKWKHWIGPEHRGGYFSLTLTHAVILYEHGLVFDRTDMDRFVRTQTAVCWNGDAANPKWSRVDGRPADGRYLCAALAAFDQRIYDLAFTGAAQQERLKGKDHPWQGGPEAGDWLEAKYLTYPKWKGGAPAETAVVAPFLSKPANQALVRSLAFEVKVPGYKAPATPAEMKGTVAGERR